MAAPNYFAMLGKSQQMNPILMSTLISNGEMAANVAKQNAEKANDEASNKTSVTIKGDGTFTATGAMAKVNPQAAADQQRAEVGMTLQQIQQANTTAGFQMPASTDPEVRNGVQGFLEGWRGYRELGEKPARAALFGLLAAHNQKWGEGLSRTVANKRAEDEYTTFARYVRPNIETPEEKQRRQEQEAKDATALGNRALYYATNLDLSQYPDDDTAAKVVAGAAGIDKVADPIKQVIANKRKTDLEQKTKREEAAKEDAIKQEREAKKYEVFLAKVAKGEQPKLATRLGGYSTETLLEGREDLDENARLEELRKRRDKKRDTVEGINAKIDRNNNIIKAKWGVLYKRRDDILANAGGNEKAAVQVWKNDDQYKKLTGQIAELKAKNDALNEQAGRENEELQTIAAVVPVRTLSTAEALKRMK